MDKRPTIIDVAVLAGVSKSTVSLVLQNSPLVKQQTRDEVRHAMVQLGYVYNRAAANLRSPNAGLIGLVINDLRNPFFTEFATSLQMALSARGFATVIANTDEDPDLQAQVVGAMLEHDSGWMLEVIAGGARPPSRRLPASKSRTRRADSIGPFVPVKRRWQGRFRRFR